MSVAVVEKTASPAQELRLQLNSMEGQFKAALPAHIPVERFSRVVMTAIQNNPELMEVDRRSLFNSAMRAAQDGLLPDGREGAMVVYRDKNKGKIAQWMPMIAGLRKKVRNSGEIATWDAQVVHANDAFEFELGDDPFIKHRPSLDDPGKVIAAYSIATLKSGEKSREVMSIADINKIRARSRAKDSGPWVSDFEEMCRKTVARRHSKLLPMSTDLDDLIRRDDDLYDMEGAREEAKALNGGRPQSIASKLDLLAGTPAQTTPEPEEGAAAADGAALETGEQGKPETGAAGQGEPAKDKPADEKPNDGESDKIEIARARGAEARAKKMSIKAVPPEYREPGREDEAEAWKRGHEGGEQGT